MDWIMHDARSTTSSNHTRHTETLTTQPLPNATSIFVRRFCVTKCERNRSTYRINVNGVRILKAKKEIIIVAQVCNARAHTTKGELRNTIIKKKLYYEKYNK